MMIDFAPASGRLGDVVADTGDHHALHIVRDGLHCLSDVLTEARLSADREDRHRQRAERNGVVSAVS